MVKRIKSSYYVIQNMDRALGFYQAALGLKLRFRDGANWAQFDAPAGSFALSSAAEAPPGAVGGTIVFEVESLEASEQAVVQQGGTILDRRDMGSHGRTLTFRDPEGNIAQLYQAA